MTTFNNTGNVEAKPEIKSVIKDSSGSTVGEVDKSDTGVQAGQTSTIESQWDTSGRDLGGYVANVAVTLDGKQIFSGDVSFDIVAVGALRLGILQKITLKNSPQPGGTADIAAIFENTTHEETQAVFVAEVYYGDQLVDAITTSEQPAPPNGTATIQTSVNVAEEGKYTVRGKVTFGGRETETKELVFKVGTGRRSARLGGRFRRHPGDRGRVGRRHYRLALATQGTARCRGGRTHDDAQLRNNSVYHHSVLQRRTRRLRRRLRGVPRTPLRKRPSRRRSKT